MNAIIELRRLPSPAPRPQSLAWDGTRLWMGSLATRRLYSIDADKWTVDWECEAPGAPFGMASVDGELRVLCGETSEDNRFIRRCVPGNGFDSHFGIQCPDDTGSQLGWDGKSLHVSQWYNRRVIAINADGATERTISVPHQICGQVIVAGILYLLTVEDESSNDYWISRADLSEAQPRFEDIARVPFQARALAFDGSAFWTNHRERHEMVRFELPGR